MSELDELRAMRAEVPEPAPAALMPAQARLHAAIHGGPIKVRRLKVRWPRIWWPGVTSRPGATLWARVVAPVGLAGLLAAGVAIAGLGHAPAGSHPGSAGGTPTTSGSKPSPAPIVAIPVSVTDLLDKAATSAEQGPELNPQPKQFLVYESSGWSLFDGGATTAGNGTSAGRTRTNRTIYLSVDNTRDGYLEETQPGGSPAPASTWHGLKQPEGGTSLCLARGGNGTDSYANLSQKPADPAWWLGYLRSGYSTESGANPDKIQKDPDDNAWQSFGLLQGENYLPPTLRAAMFRAAQQISAVRLIPDVIDIAGRKGVAIARKDRLFGTEVQYVYDLETYRYLGERQIQVDDPEPDSGLPPVSKGTVVRETALLSVKVADDIPEPGRSWVTARCEWVNSHTGG